MKIFILTEGGRRIGFGHVTRCIAICEAFEERNIYPLLVINGDDSIFSLTKGRNCKLFDWIENKEKLFSEIKDTDFIIIDSYLADKNLFYKISNLLDSKVLIVDDHNRIDYPKGIVVNPSIYGDKLNYIKKKDTIYLLGKNYIILRKEFWDVPEKKINKKVGNILITLGGINRENFTKMIANFLKNNFNIRTYIVSKDNPIRAKEMLSLMLKADICISGGGQTTYELAMVGVPAIGICFAENQHKNLLNWEKIGFLKNAGWFSNNELLIKIKEKFNELDYNSRLQMSIIGKKYIDGDGARRIFKEVLKRI